MLLFLHWVPYNRRHLLRPYFYVTNVEVPEVLGEKPAGKPVLLFVRPPARQPFAKTDSNSYCHGGF